MCGFSWRALGGGVILGSRRIMRGRGRLAMFLGLRRGVRFAGGSMSLYRRGMAFGCRMIFHRHSVVFGWSGMSFAGRGVMTFGRGMISGFGVFRRRRMRLSRLIHSGVMFAGRAVILGWLGVIALGRVGRLFGGSVFALRLCRCMIFRGFLFAAETHHAQHGIHHGRLRRGGGGFMSLLAGRGFALCILGGVMALGRLFLAAAQADHAHHRVHHRRLFGRRFTMTL